MSIVAKQQQHADKFTTEYWIANLQYRSPMYYSMSSRLFTYSKYDLFYSKYFVKNHSLSAVDTRSFQTVAWSSFWYVAGEVSYTIAICLICHQLCFDQSTEATLYMYLELWWKHQADEPKITKLSILDS